jgi:hypothetical protein
MRKMPIEAVNRTGLGRQVTVWLAAGVFAASCAGCLSMIILSARHSDVALPTAGGEIMHMPLARPAATR